LREKGKVMDTFRLDISGFKTQEGHWILETVDEEGGGFSRCLDLVQLRREIIEEIDGMLSVL
jgi:hypothetical protein